MWPYTLSSGPESGLCNQLYALAGYVIGVQRRRHGVLIGGRLYAVKRQKKRFRMETMGMPNMTSHDQNGRNVAFGDLFDFDFFRETMARELNITILRRLDTRSTRTSTLKTPCFPGYAHRRRWSGAFRPHKRRRRLASTTAAYTLA